MPSSDAALGRGECMSLLERVRTAGREIAEVHPDNLHELVRNHVASLVGWPLQVSEAAIVDNDGVRTEPFPVVIHTAAANGEDGEPTDIAADRAAVAVEIIDRIEPTSLAAALKKIADAKLLRKTKLPNIGRPVQTTTLGIVLAQTSDLPVAELWGQLKAHNATRHSCEWADMIVIADSCALYFGVQFPGESISGYMLPPARDALVENVPPFYFVPVIRPLGHDAFAWMMRFVLDQLILFTPGFTPADRDALHDGISKDVVTLGGYQFDLNGQLQPVPEEMYIGRHIPPTPYQIVAPDGEKLGAVQFVPWQDGGVIILKGILPLESLLLMAGELAACGRTVSVPPETQISCVLPISESMFIEMLNRFQRQSNMTVTQPKPSLTIQKIAEEGTDTPFVGRLRLGILSIREMVYKQHSHRLRFDERYEPVVNALSSVRTGAAKIQQLWEEHSKRVTEGAVANIEDNVTRIDESIDEPLREEFERTTSAAVRCLKTGMQSFVGELGTNIGFLFRKQPAFGKGLAELATSDAALADYLRAARPWCERLIVLRNRIEHDGWTLPKVGYLHEAGKVVAKEPQIDNSGVTAVSRELYNRVACFVEEVTAHLLAKELPPTLALTERAVTARTGHDPYRFCITTANDPGGTWTIRGHTSDFDDA